jgi:PhnB protein
MPDHPPVTPLLIVTDTARAIAFYQAAFNATEIHRLTDPAGTIVHAGLTINGAIIMLAERRPPANQSPADLSGSPVLLHLYTDDADATFERAVANGAQPLIPVKDQFYGDRAGRLKDPFGHLWIIGTRKEEVPFDEMQRRLDAMMKK